MSVFAPIAAAPAVPARAKTTKQTNAKLAA